MQHQFLYIGKGEVTPEMQFVRGLIDRKVCLFFHVHFLPQLV